MREALIDGARHLADAGVPGAARDVRLLMESLFDDIAPGMLILHMDRRLDDAETRLWHQLLNDRKARKPVSKILRSRTFWRHSFLVTEDTLDPRPETETLVSAALDRPFSRMLDLGTGTGCILLSCLADMPGATGLGTDISTEALKIAATNAQRLQLSHRADFQKADWLVSIPGRFDLITSNPPYIAAAELAALEPEVHLWEPHVALTPGGDGLDAYRVIARDAPQHLAPGGRLIVEIGPTQGAAVAAIFVAAGLARPVIRPDMDGRDRIVMADAAG
ncbi:MAG: peptide chain release factor N(5)-glutamine methyltransferase [Tabrizicola sp.]|nr:peptide chain release factor N(5)-glutamine methyltransferase [Tabrizicola sp.]